MGSEVVDYNGRAVLRESFRAWIYGHNDSEKLVNSWAEYHQELATGAWFSTKEQVCIKINPAASKVAQPVAPTKPSYEPAIVGKPYKPKIIGKK